MRNRQFEDTTDFFAIDVGDEILVNGRRYKVLGNEREQRFTLEDPKFWVKRAQDVETGERKIVKLAFFESFETSLAGIKFLCFRNPDKEGEILEAVKDHPGFMHGEAFRDSKGNNIRVLDRVRGPNLFNYIGGIKMRHEQYFRELFPGILTRLIRAFESIRFLHGKGFRHGDIRNDHIIIEQKSKNYVWIDFDFDWKASENPFGLDIFHLGNVLLYAVGKGFHNAHNILTETHVYGNLLDRLREEDFSLLDKWRLMNLKKMYPYIPEYLNNVLMHFSKGSELPYDTVDEIIEDLNRTIYADF